MPPPSNLRKMFRHNAFFRGSDHAFLPIYAGLCHVPHIFTVEDCHTILQCIDSKRDAWSNRAPLIPLLSPSSGEPFPAENAFNLFQIICAEALTSPLYPDKLQLGIVSAVGPISCDFFTFRTSAVSHNIASAVNSSRPAQLVQHDLIEWIERTRWDDIRPSDNPAKLAIVGMSCRLPGGANDPESFWSLLVDGRDTHTTIPSDRFDLASHFDPSGKTQNATEVPFGNFIDHPGRFDAAFFNMSPREAEQTDPMQRLALVSAYEALEMAGFTPNRTPSSDPKRVATFFGQASDDYREVNTGQTIGTYGIPGGERAFGNGRINYFFGFSGPSFNIDTACSSGLAAVNAACSSIWANEASVAIAGGLNVITNCDIYCMLSKGHFLSKTGQCKTWDENADGYCRADGVGAIVIKRLEDAEADNDTILATIVAAATNHSADAISITHPHAGAQEDNYRQVLQIAGANPTDVSYIELHGTGTQAGDSVESESVAEVFAPRTGRRDQRLQLGAVKSNIGHGEAAAGITSLIKTLLIFQKSSIPRHIGIKTAINPVVAKNIAGRDMGFPTSQTPWPRQEGKKRYALVNSFGAHGGNTTLLLEDAPQNVRKIRDPRCSHSVALSAKSKASMRGNIASLVKYLQDHPDTHLEDLAYTTCVRRVHHSIRIAKAVSSLGELQGILSSVDVDKLRPTAATSPPVAFVFTGQGAFYEGAGAQLFDQAPSFRDHVLLLDRFVQQHGFPSVVPSIWGLPTHTGSPVETQLSILVLELALGKLWETFGVNPSIVIGHSLGEYAALVMSGVISAADAIWLVGTRAQLLVDQGETGRYGMLSIRATMTDVEALIQDTDCEISCINTDRDIVISGRKASIDALRQILDSKGTGCTVLDLPFAFHSKQLDPLLDKFEHAASHVAFHPPRVPIVSPLLAQCVFDGKTINANYLRRASREPVNFVGAVEAARDTGILNESTIWIELGPHPVTTSFIRKLSPASIALPSIRRGEDDSATINSSLAVLHCHGVQVAWHEYYRSYEKGCKLLHLPAYSWNEKDYWVPYIGKWSIDKANALSTPTSGRAEVQGYPLQSSSVHRVISESQGDSSASMVTITDVTRPDIWAAVQGHKINKSVGVVTASIWCDMALTVGKLLYQRLMPGTTMVHMDVTNMTVTEAQTSYEPTPRSQLLQMESTLDLGTMSSTLRWFTLSDTGCRSHECFARATVRYGEQKSWIKSWRPFAPFVNERVEALVQMSNIGLANRLSHRMIYNLFQNVVDYTPKYQGMRSVVVNGLEAFAKVVLSPESHGTWNTPPHWIDSIFQLAGFVMNGSDVTDTPNFFYITPGWDNVRWTAPFEAGVEYVTYVRMAEDDDVPGLFTGDIYVLRDGTVIGLLNSIKFKRVARQLMGHLFPAKKLTKVIVRGVGESSPKHSADESVISDCPSEPTVVHTPWSSAIPALEVKNPVQAWDQPIAVDQQALHTTREVFESSVGEGDVGSDMDDGLIALIANETGLQTSEIADSSSFNELGVDSLMALTLSARVREELGVEIKSSLFLECPTVFDMKQWLKQYL